MDSFLVGEITTLGDLDRIDLANKIRYRNIGRREFFRIAGIAMHPDDFRRVTLLRRQLHASTANRRKRIVKDLAARKRRRVLVEQASQRADDPRLCLPALAEKNHVMTGEHAVFYFGDYGLLVADDSRQDLLAASEPREQILAHLHPHRQDLEARAL